MSFTPVRLVVPVLADIVKFLISQANPNYEFKWNYLISNAIRHNNTEIADFLKEQRDKE